MPSPPGKAGEYLTKKNRALIPISYPECAAWHGACTAFVLPVNLSCRAISKRQQKMAADRPLSSFIEPNRRHGVILFHFIAL
jgi:hypothetical protein